MASMSSIFPLQLSFYKGASGKFGALQFNLQNPHYFCPRCKTKDYSSRAAPDQCINNHCDEGKMKSREGALFLEITSAKDKNVYDWDRKIVMALSIQDLGKLLMILEGREPECKLMHDPGAKTTSQGKIQKWLNVTSPKGVKEGVMVSAVLKQGPEEPIKHTVPLSGDEALRLAICIRHIIPVVIGW